jgi:hypothetical protein
VKTLLQPTMSVTDDTHRIDGSQAASGHTTADVAVRDPFSGNYGTLAPETELQARLADTEARLADALNRLSFREAEIAAFARAGAVPPRRPVLMARVAELEQASEAQESELQELKSIAEAREAELRQTKTKLKALEKSAKLREAGQAKGKLKAREAEGGQAKGKLKAREAEGGQAKGELRAREATPKAREGELKQARPPRLWKVVRKSVLAAGKSLGIARKGDTGDEDLRRHIELLTASELFDRNWYLAAYPDVAASGIDPVRHYLCYGADEGRDPGPRFSTSKYLDRHLDVAQAGMNPLLHYLKFGLEEQRAIFAADRNVAASSAITLSRRPALEPEPVLGAATVFSLPAVHREEAAWIRHEALCRRQGRSTLELHGTILGWLPFSAQMVGTDSLTSLPVSGAATLFCRMMRLGEAKALGGFEGDAEFALPPPGLQGAPLGPHFLPNAGPSELADAWFTDARALRLRFAKPTPVLRFFQWDRHAGRLVLLSEAHVQASNGLADVPTINPLLPILIAASDAEGVLEGLFLLPFPSLCRGGCHYGELLASEGGSLMERLLALSASLAETWLTGDQGAFAVGRIDVDLANAHGSEMIFSRAVQLWLDGCFDVRCRPINGAAIADERVRLYVEETLGGARGKTEELSERERSASYALRLSAQAIPSLQALVARGAPPLGPAGLGASILVDGATGRPRWLIDVARLDAELLEKQWSDGDPPPRLVPLREPASQAGQPATIDAAHGFALALAACNDNAARVEPFGPVTRLAKSGHAIRNPSAQPEISVLCPYVGDEQRFAAFLDSLRLQTNLTNLEIMVTGATKLKSGSSLEGLVRGFFPDSQVIHCDDQTRPGTRLNRMAERARCDRLLVAAGVMLHDPSTLDVLRHIAAEERAATIGCVVRSAGAAGPARLHCAGFYPAGKQEPHGVVAALARLDSLAPLGSWTYPIAANPPPLFMTRETTWQELGGFNENMADMGTVAIDFAVRATTRGYVHLCTSAVTATVIDEAIAVMPPTIALPSATPPLTWRDAAAHSVVARRLVT